MAALFQTVEYYLKSVPSLFPRATIVGYDGITQYPSLLFTSGGKNVQVLSVRAFLRQFQYAETGNPFSEELSRNKLVEFSPKFFLEGCFLEANGDFMKNNQPVLRSGNTASAFAPNVSAWCNLSSDLAEFRPKCLFAGGFYVLGLAAYFGATLNSLPNQQGLFASVMVTFELDV